MLEGNYTTWCAQNSVPVDDGPLPTGTAEDAMEVDDQMDDQVGVDEDDDDEIPSFFKEESDFKANLNTSKGLGKRKKKGKVAVLVREKVEKVLDSTELAEKRARLCDEGDFLRLLWAFNQEGIHFN